MGLRNVLLVDDDTNIQIIVQVSLEDVWNVSTASSGEEALAILAKAGQTKPDLILLDMMMPGIDGIATWGKLNELPEAAGIPVIFLTAKAQPQDLSDLLKLGIASVISKPFDAITLADDIEKILSGQQLD